MPYAQNTTVPVEKSRLEIEKLLQRHGAAQFISGWDAGRAVIGWSMKGRMVRVTLPMPDTKLTSNKYDQETRRRWRALALIIKAKLEAVASGIATFENEFLAWTMLPDGTTVGAWAGPQIAEAYKSGLMPKLLPGLPAPKEP